MKEIETETESVCERERERKKQRERNKKREMQQQYNIIQTINSTMSILIIKTELKIHAISHTYNNQMSN